MPLCPKRKKKEEHQIGTPHSSTTGGILERPGMSSTGDILEIPGSDSTVEILETPCTSDTVGNISYAPFLSAMDSTPCSSGAVTQPSYHGHHIVEADRSLTTCTTCEANKKKRKALLKKHNRLKKKYEALQQSYNKLQVSTF